MSDCPKCGLPLLQAEECHHCGIVIEKYVERKKRDAASRQPPFSKKQETRPWASMPREEGLTPFSDGSPDMGEHRGWRELRLMLSTHVPWSSGFLARGKTGLGTFLDLLLILAMTTVAYTAVLYFVEYLWFFYSATPVGEHFAREFPEKARAISSILGRSSPGLASHVTLVVFVVCLVISAICRLLHVTEVLFNPAGWMAKVIFWGVPLTFVTGHCVQVRLGFQSYPAAYLAAFVPTMLLFSAVFRLASGLLPDVGGLLKKAAPLKERIIQSLSKPLRARADNGSD